MTQALLEARIGYFVKKGLAARVPSLWQVRVGWLAMLPITLSESDRERVRSRSTFMGQVPVRVPLQLLYHPAQGLADTGLTRDAKHVVRHLLDHAQRGSDPQAAPPSGQTWSGITSRSRAPCPSAGRGPSSSSASW
jgi:hypothetical protein